MTTHDLIKNHKKMHPSSHFFDRNTLDFFGEEISEMMVLPNKAKCTDSLGKEHTCYVLSSL